jgi:hypothetical protein
VCLDEYRRPDTSQIVEITGRNRLNDSEPTAIRVTAMPENFLNRDRLIIVMIANPSDTVRPPSKSRASRRNITPIKTFSHYSILFSA